MSSIGYILQRFLILEQVAEKSGVALEQLVAMQRAGCLPGPAYQVEGTTEVTSVFGVHKESMSQAFYPLSHVMKAQELAGLGGDLKAIAAQQEKAFKQKYRALLEELQAKDYGLGHLFDEQGALAGDAADTLLREEWQHYLDGTYGLCTKNATAEEIATKEIMIAKIKFLDVKLKNTAGDTAFLRAELKDAVDTLDKVSALFAPHERARSSRGKYIDTIRDIYFV